MGICDAVAANLTILYLAVIAVIKAYGLMCGRSFSGGFILFMATITVAAILIGALTWDVSRKAMYPPSRDHDHEKCRGGICWHGIAGRSPVSQVRFLLPQQQLSGRL